jgi:hypothetical protein
MFLKSLLHRSNYLCLASCFKKKKKKKKQFYGFKSKKKKKWVQHKCVMFGKLLHVFVLCF